RATVRRSARRERDASSDVGWRRCSSSRTAATPSCASECTSTPRRSSDSSASAPRPRRDAITMRLAGERVLVTGSTSGIGKHVSLMCARAAARRAWAGGDATPGRAWARSGGVLVAEDVADEAACSTLVDTVAERLGGLTVLVNNAAAGSGGQSPVGAFDTDRWERVLRVNLTAVAWLCRAAIPHMLAAGHGSIVNVSSRQAERASAGLAPYIASKGGLNALTRSIA